jgi:hypothetical protein
MKAAALMTPNPNNSHIFTLPYLALYFKHHLSASVLAFISYNCSVKAFGVM